MIKHTLPPGLEYNSCKQPSKPIAHHIYTSGMFSTSVILLLIAVYDMMLTF